MSTLNFEDVKTGMLVTSGVGIHDRRVFVVGERRDHPTSLNKHERVSFNLLIADGSDAHLWITPYTQSYVGWVEAPSGSPVAADSGIMTLTKVSQ